MVLKSAKTTILVTGGAGFIGSAFIRHLLDHTPVNIVNLDILTYAADLTSLESYSVSNRYKLEIVNICDRQRIASVLHKYQPSAIVHLAAESHVDRSIDDGESFIMTNIHGTFSLLEEVRTYWQRLDKVRQINFRFLHVSTDEVFGSLGLEGRFSENSPYRPNSPYAASKAGSDHIARAWHATYDLPVIISNCSNNYGPYQFPEKLIPLMIIKALQGKALPVYGSGENIRDWIYVDDHVRALTNILFSGDVGETYNVGGSAERRNIDLVNTICNLLDELAPNKNFNPHKNLITFVEDRPGHDLRYAIDSTKMENTFDWAPKETIESGLRKTVSWYLDNPAWWQTKLEYVYDGKRLGTSGTA